MKTQLNMSHTTREVRAGPLVLAVVACLLVAACKTSADRAAEFVTTGHTQEAAGEYDAAAASYRQALDLVPDSTDALRALATLSLHREQTKAARAQFKALHEKLPEDVDANLALAELALMDWDSDAATSYLAVPLDKDPDNARTKAAVIARDYYTAESAKDQAGVDDALDRARTLLTDAPDAFSARRIVIQSLIRSGDADVALREIDTALAARPKSLELNMMKLDVLLHQKGGTLGTDQLKAMYRDFPDNRDVQTWLKEWYLSQGDPPETIAFLRDLAAKYDDDPVEHEAIADYAEAQLTAKAATAQFDQMAKDYADGIVGDIYRAHAARLRFDDGDRDTAIATMAALLATDAPLAKQGRYRVMYAKMLDVVGRKNDAIAIVTSVLGTEPNNIDAVKLKSEWQMADGDLTGAITTLRTALSGSPRNSELLTMISAAYEADGSNELAGQSLADAVSASGNGVRETVLLVQFLVRTGNKPVAAAALASALDDHPGDPALLAAAKAAGIDLKAGAGN